MDFFAMSLIWGVSFANIFQMKFKFEFWKFIFNCFVEEKLDYGKKAGSEFGDHVKILDSSGNVVTFRYHKYIQENSLAKTLILLSEFDFFLF